MRVGILTAGGDSPGLNAGIRASARYLLEHGHEPVGIARGYRGLVERDCHALDMAELSGILPAGGTILATSGYDPFDDPEGVDRLRAALAAERLDAVIAFGGEHTMDVSRRLQEELELPHVGVPTTIDNDVPGTEVTLGFDTAVQTATEAIDRLHTSAAAHDRVAVLEVMGGDTGWIAVIAGITGGADGVVIPELELTVEEVAGAITRRHERGKSFSLIVVAEGAQLAFESGERRSVHASEDSDEYGYPQVGGIGHAFATEIERHTGFETRATALGHLQRGGTPTATDRLLATRYGVRAAEMVLVGDLGQMVAVRGTDLTGVPLSEVRGLKPVDLAYLELARTFFG
ncbi:MAG: ATP-dependent 6-phosphofructokinase [Actinomycetota bacterium]|nr:ATP-dependent 6-phosphofructokinase [Actinomycetota bacterium]